MVNKSDNNNNPAITEIPLPLFNGWCREGYWLDGKLLNRAEYTNQFSAVASRKAGHSPCETGRISRSVLFKSWRKEAEAKHAARKLLKPHKPPEATRGYDEYQIPTLDDLRAL